MLLTTCKEDNSLSDYLFPYYQLMSQDPYHNLRVLVDIGSGYKRVLVDIGSDAFSTLS